MHTSFLFLALLGPEAAPFAASPEAPIWQDSYRAALKAGREQEKPLAVLVGTGPSAWETLTDDGKPTRGARQLLADSFVCLYVDRSTPEGRMLAESFEMTGANGLVLSTRDGEGQAFAHVGKMSRAELEESLRKYGNGKVVRRTEALERVRYASAQYPDGSMRPVTSPQSPPVTGYQPVMYGNPGAFAPQSYAPPAMHMAPPMSYGGGFGSFSGGFSGGGGRGC